MTKIRAVEIHATKRRWRAYTDTGWRFSHWALTESGLRAQVRGALHACGFNVDRETTSAVVELARKHGYVTVRDE